MFKKLAAASIILWLLSVPAPAATFCWNPLASGHAWTDAVWTAGSCSAVTPGTAGPPTAADTAVFSSLDTSPVAISSPAVALDVSFTDTLGYTGTVSGSSTLTVSGSFTLSSGVVWNYTGAITFNATATGKTFTTAGLTLNNNITFNGTGGGWTNQDNLTDGVGDTITLTAGTWNTNAKTITVGIVNISGSTARTATFTNSTFNLTATGTSWNAATITSLTRTLTGSTINLQGSSATFGGGGIATYATVNLTGGGTMKMQGGNTFAALSVVGTASLTDSISLNASITVSGALTLSGNSQTQRLYVSSNGIGTNRTLSAGSVALSNVDFSNITAANAIPFTGTSIGNAGGNTNITATGAVTRYWVGNGGNFSGNQWASSSGGSSGASMPLPQDSAIFDGNSINLSGQTITMDEPRYPTMDFHAATNNPTLNMPATSSIYGSLTLGSGMTFSTTSNAFLNWAHQTGTATLTTNGVVIGTKDLITIGNIGVTCPGATLSLGDDLTLGDQISALQGTFDANGHNLYLWHFITTGTLTRSVKMGSGTWTIAQPSGEIWNVVTTGLTWDAATSTISVRSLSAPTSDRQFKGGGVTYNNLIWHDVVGANFALDITGANTFNDFKVVSAGTPQTLNLVASATQTMTTLDLNGESDNLLGLISSSSGTAATLSVASGTVICDYCSIQDSTATGGATFYASQSTNVSGNTGWTFGNPPLTQGGSFALLGVGP